MPLSPAAFTISESLGFLNLITLVDTSVGSDSSLTSRRIFIELYDGTYLVPSGTTTQYIVWDINQPTITIDILKNSTAASITVLWMNGDVAVYTANKGAILNLYGYVFIYGELRAQASTLNPNILQDVNFYNSCIAYMVNLFNSEITIIYDDDITGSQFALQRNVSIEQDPNSF